MKRFILLITAFCFSHAHAQNLSCKVDAPLSSFLTSPRIIEVARFQENNTPFIFQVKPKNAAIVTAVGISYELNGKEDMHTVIPDSQYSDNEWDGFRTVNSISHPSLSSYILNFPLSIINTHWYPADQRTIYIRGVQGNSSLPQTRLDDLRFSTVSEASLNINNIITVPELSSGEEHAIQLGRAGDFTLVGGGNITLKAASGNETGTLTDPFKTSHSGVTVAMNNNGTIAPNEDITATVRVAPDAASGPYTLNLVATANCP